MATKEIKRSPTVEHLRELTRRLSQGRKLSDWNALAEEVKNLPADLGMALIAGRPELVNLAKQRTTSPNRAAPGGIGVDVDKAQWDAVIDLVCVLLETNRLLQAHSEQVAQLVENWTGHFKGLRKAGLEIERLANFQDVFDNGDDDE